jgi:hypothetical protein
MSSSHEPQVTLTQPPASDQADDATAGLEQDEQKKPDLSGRIFLAVVGLIALGAIVGGVLVFVISSNSASNQGDLTAYPGAGYVKVPESITGALKTQLKPQNLKADIEMGLSHDDLGKVQTFYNSSMKDKGYDAGMSAPVQGNQFSGQFRSFGNGIKVLVFGKKEAGSPIYFVITTTLSDKTASSASSELGLAQVKPGDTLIMLIKLQPLK